MPGDAQLFAGLLRGVVPPSSHWPSPLAA